MFRRILKKYWGYSNFRPLQLEIIKSVYSGKDTLGLLTTGGGKSIIFQVLSLSKEGLCIVITPLIALMKDQVENLENLGIKAVAIYSGMNKREINIAFNKCILGNYKFLYLSPERIKSDLFLEKKDELNINLIAVDEAHCISQWGYDFRPSYLEIVKLREFFPDIPVLALTATATKNVVEDIQEKLNFNEKNVFKKSFERNNLSYIVRELEDKNKYLLKILKIEKGCAIVYVRNRRKTFDISNFLRKNNISSDFYHAGLDNKIKSKKQESWKKNKTRVIVSTNAFGMGIDKADVRVVVHMDLPDSLEAYFQEAGRAGRDEKKSFAVLLYNENDKSNFEKRLKTSFPEIDFIKKIYNSVCNFLQIPLGSGFDVNFDFDLSLFLRNFKLPTLETYNSLKYLEKEKYLELTENIFIHSKLIFKIQKEEIYKLQVKSKIFDKVIKLLMRNYTALFSEYSKINEKFIAKKLNTSVENIKKYLKRLSKYNIIDYIPERKTSLLILKTERILDKNLKISKKEIFEKKKNYKSKIDAVIHYASSKNKCRNQLLLFYFGEKNAEECGICDVCKENKENNLTEEEFKNISDAIKKILLKKDEIFNDLAKEIYFFPEKKIIKTLDFLLENEEIFLLENGKVSLHN